jgi:hypothetical protein
MQRDGLFSTRFKRQNQLFWRVQTPVTAGIRAGGRPANALIGVHASVI